MDLIATYKRQFGWRPWRDIFATLPPLDGARVLDLGCGIGDLSAELARRGATVIGYDANPDVIGEACRRGIPNARFDCCDLRQIPETESQADGIWCSFTAAYFPDFAPVLQQWRTLLRPGAWIALTEVDDLFGHGPLKDRTEALLQSYAEEARGAGRYDFHMGRKLGPFLEQCGFKVTVFRCYLDRELSFGGSAAPEVVVAWRDRLERMQLLRQACGEEFPALRDDFLTCLQRPDHRASAEVRFTIGVKTRNQSIFRA